MKFDIQNAFNNALSEFEFEKVHQVMELLDWKWCFSFEQMMRIPTIEDMKNHLIVLFGEAVNKCDNTSEYIIGSGGFYVVINKNENSVTIKFELTKCKKYFA